MAYFKHFPKMYYDVRGSETVAQRDVVTNILARVLVKSHGWANVDNSLREPLIGASYFTKHLIQDGDRPDILAHQYYGDSELHWLFFFVGGPTLLNPYYDWPLTQYDLKKFVNEVCFFLKNGCDLLKNGYEVIEDRDTYIYSQFFGVNTSL